MTDPKLRERLQQAWDASATLPPIVFAEHEADALIAALSPQTLPAPGEVDRLRARVAKWQQGTGEGTDKLIRDLSAALPTTVAAANDEGVALVEFIARVLWADGQRRLKQSQSDLPRTRTDFCDAARALLDHPALVSHPHCVGAGR